MQASRLFIIVGILSSTVALASASSQPAAAPLSADEIIRQADETADAQLKAISGKTANTWTWGVMQAGYADFAPVSPHGSTYTDALTAWAQKANWEPSTHKKDLINADDFCIGQTYLALYAAHPTPSEIDPLKKRLDLFVDHMQTEPEHTPRPAWYWCDSLFMAPPVLARMSAVTGDKKYIDAMDTEYWRTVALLYDHDEHLFYRDGRFVAEKDANGRKIFWSRGNGWVVAGLARLLQFMPDDYPARAKYVGLFKEMTARLATLQSSDGTWPSSLLDAQICPGPETSGTSLFTYAIAWGINNKLLDRDTFVPIVSKAWAAIIADRRPDGLAGYVESISDRPKPAKADATQLYATGTILLDALELQKLASPGAATANVDKPEKPSPDFVLLDEGPETAGSPTTQPLPPVIQPAPGATAFARYVPERFDDIAWENDRIAHRIYGPALQHAPHEHSGSGIDVWVKSVRRMVINEWYKRGKYHVDHGTGLDFYEVGLSRGDGGLGIWDNNKLWVSADWTHYKILDLGPNECGFDLTYDPWMANGRKVWETRTETLKAGSNLDRLESTIHSDQAGDLTVAVGLASRKGEGGRLVQDKDRGLMSYWQPPERNGTIGVGVLVDPAMVIGFTRDNLNYLVLLKVTPNKPFVYYAGACWNRGLDFKTADQWEQYLKDYTRD